MPSNNSDTFSGNSKTSSNCAGVFAEKITVNGGGGVGTLYNFYPLELLNNNQIQSSNGWSYVADGATALRVQRVQTESPYDFSPLNAVVHEMQWPTTYGDGEPTQIGRAHV